MVQTGFYYREAGIISPGCLFPRSPIEVNNEENIYFLPEQKLEKEGDKKLNIILPLL